MTSSNPEQTNWLDSLSWQVDFHSRVGRARRHDPEFEWAAFERSPSGRLPRVRRFARHWLYKLGLGNDPPLSVEWMRGNGSRLWATRCLLSDDTSRLMFDSALVLRLTNHRAFYFPRIDFDDLLAIGCERPFDAEGFPHEYLGVPLSVFEVRFLDRPDLVPITVVTRAIQLRLMNSYRQYLVRRNGYDISPRPGDVVFDCGACIGEVSMLFAGLAGERGEVHLFDPLHLHARFCEMQASLNPALAHVLRVNALAVGDRTHAATREQAETDRITPGAVGTDDFAFTTLDDYAAGKLDRLDFIKMDIEGAEMAALAGAANVIGEFAPRLAISGYHKPDDLWEIPARIKELNPGYELAFGHHTPVGWESVFYAVDRKAR